MCSVGWSGQTGMRFRVNPVSGEMHRGEWGKKTRQVHPPATVQHMPFLAALHFSFMISTLPSMVFASLASSRLVCLLY